MLGGIAKVSEFGDCGRLDPRKPGATKLETPDSRRKAQLLTAPKPKHESHFLRLRLRVPSRTSFFCKACKAKDTSAQLR